MLNRWLRNYPYHVDINLYYFFIATLAAAIIAILVTGYHSLSAARKNPVDSLKYE
jgi:ABC-type lipoprotein release transport system permease subunit